MDTLPEIDPHSEKLSKTKYTLVAIFFLGAGIYFLVQGITQFLH
jgi:hypothetical protein